MKGVPARDLMVLTGDFNSKIGGLQKDYPENMGSNTLGAHNERGVRLLNFCAKHGLVVLNTLFEKRRKHTWTSPD